jgi:peroxiredoxin Q/BCP
MSISEGDKAPTFTLEADGESIINLKDFRGKTVVLYFYPKDSTPGCTKEACDFRDHIQAFTKKNITIIGVSKDSIKRHDNFKAKYELPFTLVSDNDNKVCETYGTWVEKSMYGKKYMGIERSTFLIGPDGIILKVWRKVKVSGHVENVLKCAETL